MLKDIATDVDSNFYDKTLSETSVNAVQNKVITQALNKKQDVISDLSEIRNKAKSALQSVPSEYVTESELANKGYLTEHQDISGKQDKIADLAQIRANAQKGATALQTVPAEYATKTDVSKEVAKIVNSAPEAFNTLKEIADWIEEDAEPAIVLANKVEQKVDKVEGLGLSQENFTTEDKEKLEGLENYDDSDIKEELSKKIESEVVVDTESTEDFEFGYDDTEIRQELTNLSERVDENEVLIEDLQNTKIDKEADDYYPQLSVGLADNLAGVDVVDSEISFRRSGGGAISDGTARIEAIKGNSVVWNQLVTAPSFDESDLNSWLIGQGYATPNVLDNGEVYLKGLGEVVLGSTIISPNVSLIAGHTYLYAFDVKKSITETIGVYLGDVWNNPSGGVPIAADTWYHVEKVATPTGNLERGLWIYPWNNTQLTDCEAWIKNVVVYDLTQMFGAGNEPTTIEEFNAHKPLGIDESAYNEGEVIHMNAQSLESVGVNQWDEEWELGTIKGDDGALVDDSTKIRTKNLIRVLPNNEYHFTQPSQLPIRVFLYGADKAYKAYEYITSSSFLIPSDVYYIKVVFEYATYNHDICINLSDASINGKYFPYIKRTQSLAIIEEGLKSAGTAHDEIRYNKATQNWEKMQRIGSVDLGTLNLYYISDNGGYFYGKLNGAKVPSLWSEVGNILVAQYNATNANSIVATGATPFNMSMGIGPNGNIFFVNTAYTNAASFKEAMQGVMLYYELAQPIVTEIEGDFNLDYEVWNGGTEKIVSDVPTSPLKADIAYGFNAVGKIKELAEKIDNLPTAESSVFETIYDTTTYEEIMAAHNEGKVVICKHYGYVLRLSQTYGDNIVFTASSGTTTAKIRCNSQNKYFYETSNAAHSLETLSDNKVKITIAGKTAEVATPQYVQSLIVSTLNTEV